MIYAYALVFAAHFFSFGFTSYYYQTTGGGFTLTNQARVEHDGWYYHPWWMVVIIMAIVLYSFYNRSPKLTWYWVAAVVCFILGLGNILGLAAIILSCYSVYLKTRENVASRTPKRD